MSAEKLFGRLREEDDRLAHDLKAMAAATVAKIREEAVKYSKKD
jgi:hypothetical protein